MALSFDFNEFDEEEIDDDDELSGNKFSDQGYAQPDVGMVS